MARRHDDLVREGNRGEELRRLAENRDEERARKRLERRRSRAESAWGKLTGPPPADGRGTHGRAAGRVARRMRVQPHTTTTAHLRSWFPFTNDAGLAVDGPLIGFDVFSRTAFTFSVHELYRAGLLTAPNVVVIGEIGSGKSSLLKCLVFRNVPFGVKFSISADIKGEYGPLAEATGVTPLRVGPGLAARMNPLQGVRRAPGQTEEAWLAHQRTRRLLLVEGLLEIEKGQRLTDAERTAVTFGMDALTREHDGTSPDRRGEPTLGQLLEGMSDPHRWRTDAARISVDPQRLLESASNARMALYRIVHGPLSGIFDGASTSNLDFTADGTVLDLSAMRSSDEMTAMAMTCAQSWLEAELSRPDGEQRIVVYDEFALIARYLPLVRRLREQFKIARAYGMSNVIGFHRFSDLAAVGDGDSEIVRMARGLIEDTGVRISYRQSEGSLAQAREFLGTSDVVTDLLKRLKQGVAVWNIGTQYHVVKHRLSRIEKEMVQTDSRMNHVGETPESPETSSPPSPAPAPTVMGTDAVSTASGVGV